MIKRSFVITAMLVSSATGGQADQQFYKDRLWDISLHEAGSADGVKLGQKTNSCDAASQLWADHQIVFSYGLTDANHGIFSLSLRKNSWNLKSPTSPPKLINAIVSGAIGPASYSFVIRDPQTLLTGFPIDGNFNIDFEMISKEGQLANNDALLESAQTLAINLFSLPQMLFNMKGRPSGMAILFSGTEPAWSYPADDRYQSLLLAQALDQCKLALIAEASKETPSGSPTSPIPDDSADASPTSPTPGAQDTQPNPFFSKRDALGPQPNDNNSSAATTAPKAASPNVGSDTEATPAVNNWVFSSREEDWGMTCYAEASSGVVKVGFMGSPGKGLMGYVSGVFDKDTKATWQVDGRRPNVSDGGINDYFGWEAFEDLPEQLLSDVAIGRNRLQITPDTGSKLVVGLTGANVAIAGFNACFKGKHAGAPQ